MIAQNHWETAVFANDEWKYIVPSSEPSSNWNEIDYDDGDWNYSQGGFGYGDDDDASGRHIDAVQATSVRPSGWVVSGRAVFGQQF